MRVLLISRDYFPSVGGIQSHVENLYKEFQSRNEVEIFLLSRSYKGYTETDPFIHRVDNSEIKIIKAFEYVAKGRAQVKRLHKKYKFDAIHWHDLFFDSLITKQPLPGAQKIFTNHSSGFLEWFDVPKKRKYLQWLMKHADVILLPSEELHDKTAELSLPSESVYIPNGVDTEKFYPSGGTSKNAIRKKHQLEESDFVVLCPRRLEPKNGVNYFVESAKYFNAGQRKPKYLIVGGGYPEEREKMQTFIKKNQIDNVVFAGSVSNNEILHYYQASDIVVLPSLMEATSISGLEAMACGLPIVGTELGGIPALVKDGENGFLIPPRDPKAIFLKVKELMEDDKKVMSFSAQSRLFAERDFSWRVIAGKVLSNYSREKI